MIEVGDHRIRWDGTYNYVVERKAKAADGSYRVDKEGEQVYNKQGYHGGHLPSALASLHRRLVQDEFQDGATIETVASVVDACRSKIDGAAEEFAAQIQSLLQDKEDGRDSAK